MPVPLTLGAASSTLTLDKQVQGKELGSVVQNTHYDDKGGTVSSQSKGEVY